MPLSIALDYLFLTLWGWPGVLLAVVASVHLVERAYIGRVVFSTRNKLILAGSIITIGLFSTWQGQSLPLNSSELAEQLREREREAKERKDKMQQEEALQNQAQRLREELSGQQRR